MNDPETGNCDRQRWLTLLNPDAASTHFISYGRFIWRLYLWVYDNIPIDSKGGNSPRPDFFSPFFSLTVPDSII